MVKFVNYSYFSSHHYYIVLIVTIIISVTTGRAHIYELIKARGLLVNRDSH